MPDRIESMFALGRISDVHVNVGHQVGDAFVDGDPTGVHVLRQFGAEQLTNENLALMGLRTHYSAASVPEGFERKFVPSVSLNWLGIQAENVEIELQRLRHPRPIIWFQSFRDPYHQVVVDSEYRRATAVAGEENLRISHTDEFGKLTSTSLSVLEIARDYGAIIATPHSNYERTVPLINQAVAFGLSVLWVHPDSRLINTPLVLQEALARMGKGQVFVERAAVFLRDGKAGFYSPERVVRDVRTIGKDHIIFSSDLGRYKPEDSLLPSEGLRWYAQQLINAGLTIEEAEMGLVVNPSRLLKGE